MREGREPFFFWMAVLLIAIVVSGFSIVGISRPGGPMATPLFLHFHGAVFLGWFVLLAAQARLMGAGAGELHKKLGLASISLALAIVVIGYFVVEGALAKPGFTIAGRPAVYGSVFPITDIVNFSIAYTLGVLNRGNSAAHKRFMLIAAMLMIDPAMARLVMSLGLPGMLILALEVSLFLALIAYDLIKLRRPHWASLIGLALYVVMFSFKLNIQNVSWWPQFIDVLF